MRLLLKTTIFLVFCLFSLSSKAAIALIRDAQTEKFLRDLCRPIFLAADLKPDEIDIFIVNDSSINAFVSGGKKIFINTGLITKYNTPDALIGVIAHEVGHIKGGHIARSSEEMRRAGSTMLLSYLLGIGAFIAGSPEAGQGIILGGSNIAEKLYLKFSRTQEEAADRYALQYLSKIKYPAGGLIELLEFFHSQYRGYQGQIDEYAMSHPISSKRIDYLKHNAPNGFSDRKINAELMPQMRWVLLKLEAFTRNPDEILQKYQKSSNISAKYAKSIAFFRQGRVKKSLKLLNQVILAHPNDGFLYELQGQIEYESGLVKDSIISYQKAIKLLENRDSSQAKIYFSSAILALKSNDLKLIKLAIANLKSAQKYEQESPFLHKNLANAYHEIGEEGLSYAALAEYNFLIGQDKKALKYISTAKKHLKSKIELLKLDDLEKIVQNRIKNAK